MWIDWIRFGLRNKKGRYEYGPGIYIITDYDIAKKYSKGNRSEINQIKFTPPKIVKDEEVKEDEKIEEIKSFEEVNRIRIEIRYRKKIKELRKRDPFIYKWTTFAPSIAIIINSWYKILRG